MRTFTEPVAALARHAALLLGLLSLQGCYYLQAVNGQLEIWRRQQPIDEVIADPAVAPRLKERLRLLRDAREFASAELGLPDNGSYRHYADLGRDYVLWNVIAAPEFSLEPRTWCYLFVGCLAYRGYFDEAAAQRFADRLRDRGFDVFVGGVPAYSTLGKFDDPLLNTMLTRPDEDIVALLFHELAHQQLYVADDTAFNESFASAVAEFGIERFLLETGRPAAFAGWQDRQRGAARMMTRVGEARDELAQLYARDMPVAAKRAAKARILADLSADLDADVSATQPWGAFNNARLASLSLYRGYLPAFRAVFAACDERFACFYERAAALAELPPAERAVRLKELGQGRRP